MSLRIAVSGTHCSGKSTLIEDFLAVHSDYVHEPEPYEWLVELYGEAPDFHRQLEFSVERLRTHPPGARVIIERSPLDFLAYLRALGEETAEALELVAAGMEHVDLLVVLPLENIPAPEDEDPELREAMDEHLLEIVAGEDLPVVEIRGTRAQRLAALEAQLAIR